MHECTSLIAELIDRNQNNIGYHDLSDPHLSGCRLLEAELVNDLAGLCGDSGDCTGWLTSGGTEGNLSGLLAGREWSRRQPTAATPVIVCSELAHESVFKAAHILGVDVSLVPVDGDGRIAIDGLQHSLARCRATLQDPIVVVSAGNTRLGTVDDVCAASVVTREYDAYLHVDACIGGMVLAFTDPTRRFAFHNEQVRSVAIDLHKSLRAPLGIGAFLCRRSVVPLLERPGGYSGVRETAVLGSRSGALAAAGWLALNSRGSSGIAAELESCLALKSFFLDGLIDVAEHLIHDPMVNVVGVARSRRTEDLKSALPLNFLFHTTRSSISGLTTAARGFLGER